MWPGNETRPTGPPGSGAVVRSRVEGSKFGALAWEMTRKTSVMIARAMLHADLYSPSTNPYCQRKADMGSLVALD